MVVCRVLGIICVVDPVQPFIRQSCNCCYALNLNLLEFHAAVAALFDMSATALLMILLGLITYFVHLFNYCTGWSLTKACQL